MNFFGAVALFVGGMLAGVVFTGYLLHRSHKAFTEAVTKSPKGK